MDDDRLNKALVLLEDMARAVVRVEAGQTQLRVEMMARMDRFDGKLTDLRGDILVNMGRAGRAQDAAESTRNEPPQGPA